MRRILRRPIWAIDVSDLSRRSLRHSVRVPLGVSPPAAYTCVQPRCCAYARTMPALRVLPVLFSGMVQLLASLGKSSGFSQARSRVFPADRGCRPGPLALGQRPGPVPQACLRPKGSSQKDLSPLKRAGFGGASDGELQPRGSPQARLHLGRSEVRADYALDRDEKVPCLFPFRRSRLGGSSGLLCRSARDTGQRKEPCRAEGDE